ncbi:protein-disulfide isomerase [Pantoea sp. PNA 14-12]|uniref:thioredoxin domain-containing protein n=1 Tax=Pantoea TaxID=53335 RepID=UPI00105C3D7B|nr:MULTISPECIES: thioredoxin domain-containing protein [Pantoea]TDS68001.1 protein-disulfide isomerase [Pantoea sp. PNA 14-12]
MLKSRLVVALVLMGSGAMSVSAGLPNRPAEEEGAKSKLHAPLLDGGDQTEALIRAKLLNDPMSPVVGAKYPTLKIVTFTNYDCMDCKKLEKNQERLLKNHIDIAITYKLLSYGSDMTTAATRTALSVWIEQPEKFYAFHHALMFYRGMPDDSCIRSAVSDAGVKLKTYRQDTQHIIDVNKALFRRLHLTDMPTTIIGDNVLTGVVPYQILEKALDEALRNS